MAAGPLAPHSAAEAREIVDTLNDRSARTRRAHAADLARRGADVHALLAANRALGAPRKTHSRAPRISAAQIYRDRARRPEATR